MVVETGETGSEWRGGTCGRSLAASCHVWSRRRASSVAKWLELKCFFSAIRRTPPEINTHLSSAGKQAAADVCDMKVHICVCVCARVSSKTPQKSFRLSHVSENFLLTGCTTTGELDFLTSIFKTCLLHVRCFSFWLVCWSEGICDSFLILNHNHNPSPALFLSLWWIKQ